VSKSSSGHVINGDRRLSKLDRIRWICLNWLNNRRANSDLDDVLEIARFANSDSGSLWAKIDAGVSPSRRLGDLFWLSLPWKRIASALHGSVQAVEVGCGSGKYGLLVQQCLREAFAGYVGVDVSPHPDWDLHRVDPRFHFVRASSEDVQQHLGDANLIITQSALEHFEQDLTFFEQIADYVARANRPLIQFHLMPSAACLSTFPWHGVRQYTPRTVSLITRLFGAETSKRLYFLGSSECNRLHRRYITYPQFLGRGDRRQANLAQYDRELRQAVQHDDRAPRTSEACFLALVLQSGIADDIFSQSVPDCP
jgi:hypothetical protein